MAKKNVIQIDMYTETDTKQSRKKSAKYSPKKEKWEFTSRLKRNAFGWRSSRLACKRVKEAVSEIKKVSKKNPVLAGEGGVLFIEKVVPAIQNVNSSSGAMGTAVRNAVADVIPIIAEAPVSAEILDKWRERVWTAFGDDGYGYLNCIGDHWGDLCESKKIASEYADTLLPALRSSWATKGSRYFHGTYACLSCMLKAERYNEIIELIDLAPYLSWDFRKYGVTALVQLGKADEALQYAENSRGINDYSPVPMAIACEKILIDAGRRQEAYEKYGRIANLANSNLTTFRAIARTYPEKDKQEILQDLIGEDRENGGKWFATAKSLGMFNLAIELVRESPCEPKTLNRAAEKFMDENPEFAMNCALLSLRWIADGFGYESTGADVFKAQSLALKAAEHINKTAQTKKAIAELCEINPSYNFVRDVLQKYLTE